MTDEDFTPEEAQAYEAMQNEGEAPKEEVTEEVSVPEASATESEGAEGKQPEEAPVEEKPEAEKKEQPTQVPHAALHAEREKRKEVEQRLKALEQQIAGATKEPEPAFVDALVDPEGHRKWVEHQTNKPQAAIEAMQQQQQAQAKLQERVAKTDQYEAEFRTQTPDYDDAVSHLMSVRKSELAGAGYEAAEIQRQISADINNLYDAAEMAGMNPAQLAYFQAQQRGYQARPAEQPTPTPAETVAENTAKVEAAANAQKQTEGAGGGYAGGGTLTAADLANMSEAELAKVPDAAFAAAMGG